jgi:TIR domain
MAHAAGYEHDIFISYAHDDNHAPGDIPGWVDHFQEWLESWLIRRRGLSELSVWRDSRRMSGNTLFDDAIKGAVNRSALFFAFASRNYLKSDYCRDELNWFHQRNGATPTGLKVGDGYRIFTILLNNIPHDQYQQWSPALKGTTGFAFHDATSDHELGDFLSTRDERFERQLRPLVDAVEAILTPMATAQELSTIDSVASGADTIYVADVAETLQPFRNRLIAEIESRRGNVLSPVPPPPWEHETHGDQVRQALNEARFSIHLFDQWPGHSIIDREETTYPREQLAIVQESRTLPLIWVPPELDIETIENETQRRFLLNCAHGHREAGQYEFIRTPQTAFINLVLEKLAQPLPAEQSVKTGHSYLVDTHQKDQRHAFKLADYLAEFGVDVDFNHESGDPLVSLSKFEHAIRQVKNLIIVFGKVAPDWLTARIKLAVKAICEQVQCEEQCCLENIWVYRVPASRDDVTLPQLPPILKIKILDNSHTPCIDPGVAAQLLVASSPTGGGL